MPAVNFEVIWPDGTSEEYYSPSTVITEHLTEGKDYLVDDFQSICQNALNLASERVYRKFGFYCLGATSSIEKINHRCTDFGHRDSARVTLKGFK